MAWDSSRPVDWNRLVREWVIYVGIMIVVFIVLFRDRPILGVVGGALLSFPLYLGLGWVLAKFGLQRDRRRRGARSADAAATAPATASSNPSAPRSKPAPTKRTAAGTKNRPKSATKRRR